MSQFTFLRREWASVFEAASKAEAAVHADPRTACFYARRTLELAVSWAYKHDAALRLPYQDNLSALIHEPSFKQAAGEAVFSKARVINTLGNRAVHSHRAVAGADALAALRELFHVAYWFARSYARAGRPPPGLAFDPTALPRPAATGQQTAEQLRALEERLRERDEKLTTLLADKGALDEELKRLRAEVAKAKQAAAAQPDTHDYSEAETRDYFIDLLLKEAGWRLDQARDREFEVSGMPNAQGKGFVDYVLWGDDGKPLGLVEAKRTRRDARVGQQQAKLYADCLERQFGQRPIIFYSNGYEHWTWDDTHYPPRRVQGFYKKAELELSIQRRETRRTLAEAPISPEIVERHYQTRAIRRIAEAFESDHDRKALLVMATGAGKTRTVIALSDLLMRCNWAKRVLFLADRIALVNQAMNAFKRHLPDASPVNLVTEKTAEGRVYVSTYPTMMGLIDEARDGQRRFGVGHFDLVIIDEAHRSVFQKYSAIFDYFDSLLIGLTATPKDEVGRNTYRLFELEDGVPTDAYSLEEAVRDDFLVPPNAVSVPLKFQREGIKYDELSAEDKDLWDAVEWGRRRHGAGPGRGRGGQQVAVQQGHGGQGAGAPDDPRRDGRRRRSAWQDDPLCQEPSPRGVHRRAFQRQLSALQGRVRPRHHLQDGVRAEPDRQLLGQGEEPPPRDLGGHAGHRHRRAGGCEFGLLQAGALEDQVLANGGSRHAALSRSVRAGSGQGTFLSLRLLRKPRILQPRHPGHRGLRRRFARQALVQRTVRPDCHAGRSERRSRIGRGQGAYGHLRRPEDGIRRSRVPRRPFAA